LVSLSAAAQHLNSAIDTGSRLNGGSVDKVICKLLGQLEEIPAQNALAGATMPGGARTSHRRAGARGDRRR
jgi:hypothetical protein